MSDHPAEAYIIGANALLKAAMAQEKGLKEVADLAKSDQLAPKAKTYFAERGDTIRMIVSALREMADEMRGQSWEK